MTEDYKESVFQMMYKCNRPTVKAEIVAYFKGEIKPSVLQDILDTLENEGSLITKIYGKSKVYLINQDLFNYDEEGEELDRELNEYESRLAVLKSDAELVEKEVEMFNKILPIEQIIEQIDMISARIEDNKERLNNLQNNEIEVDSKDMAAAKKGYEKAICTLKRMKKVFDEVIDKLSEGLDMKKSQLYEEIGIEV
ncbi:Tat binding protein 1-interacting protein [Ordospora colligata]|uniref:Tat binding protein 1-interacting protein n=1 Tax=Ordospora colligata OC4 TaxID=1354746 RepID=A0A0B2UM52_9MICR|nr:Tat binding protein 1-interacting protein [Ordospora colligata OC4]KHN70433.1 Tat binding protein 1-interacting protein [Ordospora colligata OC4]TBU17183.1 Tat binding protein 1-interacting protein [Ordospora colligata]TBU17433.1 Tat binding protein 1-interacting protein [Ordospora colligata]TBU19613.1 Tat binding protein 1-interacting protein [Ordospora colligata]